MRGEAATPTRCSAARWFRSLVLALSKCLVAAAPKIRPVVSMAPAGCVAGPADCKVLDWLPHFLRCADGPAGCGCLCGCIWLCCLGMPCHQELDQGMRRWASWWLALQQPAGGRSQMADGEGREGRWWPVGGLARTKPAALRATRLHPCVVTLGLASNTPRRRSLNACGGAT